MCKPFDAAETRCPQCRSTSQIAPPFNLDYFECPRCRAALYPFVWIDGCLVDLVGMNELLSAIHFDAEVARGVLSALRMEKGRGERLEPLLHVETLAAHALVALARAATPQLTWWTTAGMLHPGLFGSLWVAQLAKAKYDNKKVVEKLLVTDLSRERFDPRVFPPFQASARTVRVLDRLDFGTGWPEVLYGGAESCAALGTREASAWSLLIDRRKRLTGKAATRVRTEPFVAEVVSQVVSSERDVDVLRSERELVLARVNELPTNSPLRAGLAQIKGTVAPNSPRARRVATLNRVIESANLSNGDVDWSCVRSQDQGPMMGVRWVTYHRSAWGRGVFLKDRQINPSAHLAAEAERKAILDEEGNIVDQMLEAIPAWLKATGLVTIAFLMGWTWLSTAVEANPFAFDSPPLNGARALFALGLAVTWWRRRKALRNPFPEEFWEPSQLNWEQAKARRIDEIKTRISKLWRKFDHAPRLPISTSFGATKIPD
ncbi:MAG TPA: hypothetical protein VJR89_10130, partial [Polyangiales bacterium]|nr:hypothetical protein [Polyangiales bacterium]